MSTKNKFTFKGIKRAFARTKQSAFSKIGKSQDTVDIQFDDQFKQFDSYKKIIKGTQRHIHNYMKALRKVTGAEQELVEIMGTVFEASSRGYQAYAKYAAFCGQMETQRTTLEDSLRTQLDEPLEDYIEQFETLKKRVDERKRRLVDMDRYRADYEKFQQKAKDQEKVLEKQTKFANMKQAYEELNEELKVDMPRLIKDRATFYTPLFAMLVHHENEYYKGASAAAQSLPSTTEGINPKAAHQHAQVVTPEQVSAHTMEINLNAAVKDEDDDLKTTSNEPPNTMNTAPPPSSSTGLQPPAAQNNNNNNVGLQPPKRSLPQRGPPVLKARALYPFQGQDSSELSFKVGDILIVHSNQGDWWDAELKGQKGLIPGNYVQLI